MASFELETLRGRRAFVTGAAGRLGIEVTRALREAGCGVRALRHRTPLRAAVAQRVDPGGLDAVDGDLLAPDSFAHALDGCDFVVHLAGIERGSAADLKRLHADATADLARVAAGTGVRRFVLMSTAGVHGDAFARADEDHPCAPRDAFAASKLDAERAARDSFPGEVVALRPSAVYFDDAACALVVDLLLAASAPLLPRGDAAIDMVHADDVAACIARALAAPAASGAYHVAGPEPAPFEPLMLALAGLLRRVPDFIDESSPEWPALPAPLRALATVERTLSIEKARRELGFAPRRRWDDAFVAAARKNLGS